MDDLMTIDELLDGHWYHSIEVAPGVVTPGKEHRNITITRTLLDRAETAGRHCLDIGTADGLLPLALERAGAHVVGQDFDNRSRRMGTVQHLLGSAFTYWGGTTFYDMRARAKAEDRHPFDVVVLSAVLDHVYDPLSVMAAARGMVRDGGLMLVETSAIVSEEMAAQANVAGRFFHTTNYWEMTIACMDYWLRVLRLEPIDAEFFRLPKRQSSEFEIARVGIMARAVTEPPVHPDDTWARRAWSLPSAAFLDWRELRSRAEPVPYAMPDREQRPTHDGTSTLDVYADLTRRAELRVPNPDDYTILRLP